MGNNGWTIIVAGIRPSEDANDTRVTSLVLKGNSLKETHFHPGDLDGSLLNQQEVKGIQVSDDIIYVEQPGIKEEKGVFLGMKDKGLASLNEEQLNSLKEDTDLLSRFDSSDFGNEKER